MSLPQFVQKLRQPFRLAKLFGEMLLWAWRSDGDPVKVVAENTGEIRLVPVVSDDQGTTLRYVDSEPTGELRIVFLGSDDQGTTLRYIDTEATGEQRVVFLGSDDQGTTLRYIDTEATGEQRTVNVGSSDGGTTLERFKTETTGEQDVVVHGKDSGGAIDPIRTNASQQVQIEVVGSASTVTNTLQGADEASNADTLRTDPDRILWTRPRTVWQDIDPVEIPVAEGDLWDPGGLAATITYEVEFFVVNNNAGGASVTVSVGLDLASGGSLASPEYWMFEEVIPYPGSSGWRGPFIMHGDDQIRGVASVANDASIHFRVKRVDTGA